LQLADDIDWKALAMKYELTGGFIKNAVLSALSSAVNRDKVRTPLHVLFLCHVLISVRVCRVCACVVCVCGGETCRRIR